MAETSLSLPALGRHVIGFLLSLLLSPFRALPRRALGRRVMNEVTRLVVVSWGKASKEKKERVADDLGVERGA